MTIADIASLIMGIVALIGIFVTWRKVKPDINKINAETDKIGIDASASAAEAITSYSEENRRLREQIENLEVKYNKKIETLEVRYNGKIELMQTQIAQMQGELIENRATLDEWSQGINRLLAQLISMNTQPVWKPKTGPLKLPGGSK